MKIILLQRVLPVYREPLFASLHDQASAAGHEFDLWVSAPGELFARRGTAGNLGWARLQPVSALPPRFTGLEWQHLPWRLVMSADVLIVPDNLRVLSNFAALLLRRLLRKPVLTWGHGVNFQPSGWSRRLARLRGNLLRLADRNLVYTDVCVPSMLALGFPRERIGITGNAIDGSSAVGLHSLHPEVLSFRQRYGLGDDPGIVFLGSWYARKRPEVIVEIGQVLRKEVPNARVLVIGGGLGLDRLKAQNFPWLTLLGPLHGREKFVALSAARCLAVTGVAGLNLLDAMAVGLPVVVPERTDHSPEVSYVINNYNGIIIDDHIEAIAAACGRLILDNNLWFHLHEGAIKTNGLNDLKKVSFNLLNAAQDSISHA